MKAVDARQWRDLRRARRHGCRATSVGIDSAMIDARRHREQDRGSAPTPFSACRLAVAKAAAASARPAALPLCRRRIGARAAGADDEHHQWRRACRQPDRLPGIHDHAGRRAELSPRRVRMGVGNLPHAQEGAAPERRPQHQCGRRRRLRAEPASAPTTRSTSSSQAIEQAGLQARRATSCSRSIAPRPSSSRTASTMMRARARRSIRRAMADYLADLVASYPIVSIEDGMAEDDLGGLEAAHRSIGDKVPARRRRSVRHQCQAPADGHRQGPRQLDPGQGQPDRHAHRRRWKPSSMAQRAGYTAVMSHRSGETEDSTIADLAVATNCGQIKTGSLAPLRPAGEVQPAAPHRGRAGRTRRAMPARPRSASWAEPANAKVSGGCLWCAPPFARPV